MSRLLEKKETALLVIDVQERINAVMADQDHVPRIEVLVEACRGLEVPVVASEQYPQGLGAPTNREQFTAALRPRDAGYRA